MTAGYCAKCACELVGTEPIIIVGNVEAVFCYRCATKLLSIAILEFLRAREGEPAPPAGKAPDSDRRG